MQKRQDGLFLRVYSFYMAAVCEKERESMPVVGIAKDRQVLRPLNSIMASVSSKICFSCAQIYSWAPLWSYMYTPGKWGIHFDAGKNMHWSEHTHSRMSQNRISMFEVHSSLQRFFNRDERCFRLHFSLRDFKERYCSDSQPDGNPFRNCKLFDDAAHDWSQDLQLGSSRQVIA